MARKKENLTSAERLEEALVPDWEQPYKVPENWCWTRIAKLCSLSNGKAFKPTDWTKTGIPIVRIQNLNNPEAQYNLYSGAVEDKFRLCGGELLFAWSGTPGTSFGAHIWWGKEAVLNQHIFRVDFDEKYINKIYFKYAINQQLDMLISVAHGGAGLQHVTKGVFEATPIPLPPFAEQHRIVDRIESLFAKLDEAKQKAQDALDSFETRKAAILHKAFTGELTAQWRKEHGVGMESWRTVTFKDACLKITDGTHHSPVNTPTGEYMYVTAKNIKETGIDLTNITFVSKDVHDEIYSRCDVQYGDVLYIKDGATTGIATVNTIEEPFSLLSSVAVLRPDKKQIMAEYMVYNLNSSKTKAMMINNMSGNAITRLTLSKIKTAPITVCSLDEQAEIVRLLGNLFAKEKQAKKNAEKVLEQIDLIKKAILARAFRGELGTNDPSEESAVELLKQVL